MNESRERAANVLKRPAKEGKPARQQTGKSCLYPTPTLSGSSLQFGTQQVAFIAAAITEKKLLKRQKGHIRQYDSAPAAKPTSCDRPLLGPSVTSSRCTPDENNWGFPGLLTIPAEDRINQNNK